MITTPFNDSGSGNKNPHPEELLFQKMRASKRTAMYNLLLYKLRHLLGTTFGILNP
jgi:hypothetical protein